MSEVVTLEIDEWLGHAGRRRALPLRMSDSADRDAVELLRSGQERGFDLAYARHADRIFGFLMRLSRSREVAEDLFQITFLRLAEHGVRLRPDSDLRAWLFAVARNAYYSRARAALAEAPPAELDWPSASGNPAESRLSLGDLERALAALAIDDREILLLIAVEGMSAGEAATLLGLDQAAVRKRLSRARERLARTLAGTSPRVASEKATP